MARKKRDFTTFNLSFLDIMSCGFGAVILVFLIMNHSWMRISARVKKALFACAIPWRIPIYKWSKPRVSLLELPRTWIAMKP
jgi:hypothetical protein